MKSTRILPAHRLILDAARELFAERGFSDATVRVIAKKADVNLAAVNYYFRSKDQLYEAVYKDAFDSIDTGMDAIAKSAENARDDESWRAAVDAWVGRVLFLFLTDDPEISTVRKLVVRERSQPTPFCEDLLNSFFMPIISVLRRLVGMAMPGRPAAETQAAFVSFLGQCTCFLDHDKPWDKVLICQSLKTDEWIGVMRAQITANIFARLSFGGKR